METNLEQNNNNVETLDTDYIKTINDLKANTVSKDEYNKLLDESRKLVNQLATNQTNANVEQEAPKKTTQEIRNELFNKEHTNLEFCQLSLELRDKVLEEEGKDIFVANNSQYTAGQDSYDSAERVAKVMSECIEYAQGNSEAFTNELMRRTNDVNLRQGR